MRFWTDPHDENNRQRIVWEEEEYYITEKGCRYYVRAYFSPNRIGPAFRSIADVLAYLVRNGRIRDFLAETGFEQYSSSRAAR